MLDPGLLEMQLDLLHVLPVSLAALLCSETAM